MPVAMADSSKQQVGEFKYLPSLGPAPVEEILALQKEREAQQMSRAKSKFKENPFVPIGCIGTAGILIYGLISMKRGNQRMSQLMMRARVIAQSLTVAALLGGVILFKK